MSDQPIRPEKPQPPSESGEDQTPPPAAAADVPPPESWLNRDQMDAQENARRSGFDRWSTDILLMAALIFGSIVTIFVMVRFVWPLLRRHFHRRSVAALSHYWAR